MIAWNREAVLEADYTIAHFTPFCVENAQMATLPSLIYAHFVGVLNEKRCKCAKV